MPKCAVPADFIHGDRVLIDHTSGYDGVGGEVVTTGSKLVQVELEDRDHRHIAVTPDHLTLAER